MGFATSWLIFLPKNQKESRFRYLGQQKIGSHQTHVLAFAQIRGVTHLDTVVGPANGRCATHAQGVVWIDQSTYRVVRIQIDLLSPATRHPIEQAAFDTQLQRGKDTPAQSAALAAH